MQQNQLWRVGSILGLVWGTCLFLQFLMHALHHLSLLGKEQRPETLGDLSGKDWITLVLTLTFLITCIQPFFGCFYRTARTELLKVIIEIFKAPFGKVRFRDFFFADIITSMSVPLVDMALVFSYFKQGSWKS